MSETADRELWRHPGFLLILVLGVAARTVGLFGQTLVGDELHAFRFAPRVGFPEILYTYHWTANSPPLNAWLRALMDLGLQPSELSLRIPVWLTGLATLLAVPSWLARRFGTRVAVVVAGLLAISPQLIFYSRFMRPYVPLVLVSAVAAGAFWNWWFEGSRRAGYLYAVTSVVAMWLHPVVAPFVIAPWAVVVLERRLEPLRSVPRAHEWLRVAAVQAGLLLCVFGPALRSLLELAQARRAGGLTLRTVSEVGVLLSGSGNRILAALFWLAVLYGGVILFRRDRTLGRYATALGLAQVVGVPILTPAFIDNRAIFARYILVVLIPLFTLVALALTAHAGRGAWALRRLGIPILLAAWAWTGPLANADFFSNPLATRPELLHFPDRGSPLRYPPAEPYALMRAERRGSVVEFPALPLARFFNPLSDYYRSHGRRVLLSPGYEEMTDPRLGLRTIIAAEPQVWLDSTAAYLVLHRDWAAELGPTLGQRRRPAAATRHQAERQFGQMKRLADRHYRALSRVWGPPDSAASHVAVWDLERLRRERDARR